MFNVSAAIAMHCCSDIFHTLKHYCSVILRLTILENYLPSITQNCLFFLMFKSKWTQINLHIYFFLIIWNYSKGIISKNIKIIFYLSFHHILSLDFIFLKKDNHSHTSLGSQPTKCDLGWHKSAICWIHSSFSFFYFSFKLNRWEKICKQIVLLWNTRQREREREREKGPNIQRHFCTAYSLKMNSCLVVWSCRTMRRISGKWALGWHCTHTLRRGGGGGGGGGGGISTLERI